ncbi:nitrate/nitrite transporter ATP-binding protein NtrA [Gluconacetobacter johannae DSM 13595]|uniref:ABC transporter substrate-binding protein n=1 Tax=Gluconacetobacter johannae TaxID=112140 RepID=A0A7W4P1W0_9PROT|nr:ABC transporter substrate-binding protein [Gluconacetobacter johannae]MBB2174372.1 ABC transporter substrate-binding protein [Gluconacetobacter johannae]GBQ85120.1 nitrate/nitrite transporter ATP-binding protein NtrA [Gluconacetobacter johannae DSM 13595]
MSHPLRIGVLRLADSAPIVVARNAGLFERHGLSVDIAVSPSWANIADGLVWNGLDSALIFPPLAMMTALGRRGRKTGLRPVQAVSFGGNMIVLRGPARPGHDWTAGRAGHRSFRNWKADIGRTPRLAVVHAYSTHLLILTRFLSSIGISVQDDVQLKIMPPDRIIDALSAGSIDGFCAGPPWGEDAARQGLGFVVAGSAAICPGHVEKVLVLNDQAHIEAADLSRTLLAALHDAIALCVDPANADDIARQLAAPLAKGGLALPFAATRAIMPDASLPDAMVFKSRSWDHEALGWMVSDMQGLGWISPEDVVSLERLGWLTQEMAR